VLPKRKKQALEIINPNTGKSVVVTPTAASSAVSSADFLPATTAAAPASIANETKGAGISAAAPSLLQPMVVTRSVAPSTSVAVAEPVHAASVSPDKVAVPSQAPVLTMAPTESAAPIAIASVPTTGSAAVAPLSAGEVAPVRPLKAPTASAVAAALLAGSSGGLSMKEQVHQNLIKREIMNSSAPSPAPNSTASSLMVTPSSSPGPYVDPAAAALAAAVPALSLAAPFAAEPAAGVSVTMAAPVAKPASAVSTIAVSVAAALESQVSGGGAAAAVSSVSSSRRPDSSTVALAASSAASSSLSSPAPSPSLSPPLHSSSRNSVQSSMRDDSSLLDYDEDDDDDDAFETPDEGDSGGSDLDSESDGEMRSSLRSPRRLQYSHNVLLMFQRRFVDRPHDWSFIAGITCLLSPDEVIKFYNAKALNVSFSSHRSSASGSGSSRGSSEFRRDSGRDRSSSMSGRHSGGGGGGGGGGRARTNSSSSASAMGVRQRSNSSSSSGHRSSVGQSIEDPNLPALVKSAARWKIGSAGGTAVLGETAKKIKGILNKISLDNFKKLCEDLMLLIKATISSMDQLIEVVNLIFDKALAEPAFGMIYADLCSQLNQSFPSIKHVSLDETGQPLMHNGAPVETDVTFKKILLNKCQGEFEDLKVDAQPSDSVSAEEAEMIRMKAKARKLGNIKFIGELFKRGMISEKIIHTNCIQYLLMNVADRTEEEFEALCKLLTSVGQELDENVRAKSWMDAYFKALSDLISSSDGSQLPSRVRFMIRDVCDLRASKWRKRIATDGPKKLDASSSRPGASGHADARTGSGNESSRTAPSPTAFGASSRGSVSGSGSVPPGSGRVNLSSMMIRSAAGSAPRGSVTSAPAPVAASSARSSLGRGSAPLVRAGGPATGSVAASSAAGSGVAAAAGSSRPSRRPDNGDLSMAPDPSGRSMGRGRSLPTASSPTSLPLSRNLSPQSSPLGLDSELPQESPVEDSDVGRASPVGSTIVSDSQFEDSEDDAALQLVKRKIGAMLREFWNGEDMSEALACIRELPGSETEQVQSILVCESMMLSFESKDKERVLTATLLERVVVDSIVSSAAVGEGCVWVSAISVTCLLSVVQPVQIENHLAISDIWYPPRPQVAHFVHAVRRLGLSATAAVLCRVLVAAGRVQCCVTVVSRRRYF
jgi:hypothetical protein